MINFNKFISNSYITLLKICIFFINVFDYNPKRLDGCEARNYMSVSLSKYETVSLTPSKYLPLRFSI